MSTGGTFTREAALITLCRAYDPSGYRHQSRSQRICFFFLLFFYCHYISRKHEHVKTHGKHVFIWVTRNATCIYGFLYCIYGNASVKSTLRISQILCFSNRLRFTEHASDLFGHDRNRCAVRKMPTCNTCSQTHALRRKAIGIKLENNESPYCPCKFGWIYCFLSHPQIGIYVY